MLDDFEGGYGRMFPNPELVEDIFLFLKYEAN